MTEQSIELCLRSRMYKRAEGVQWLSSMHAGVLMQCMSTHACVYGWDKNKIQDHVHSLLQMGALCQWRAREKITTFTVSEKPFDLKTHYLSVFLDICHN